LMDTARRDELVCLNIDDTTGVQKANTDPDAEG
jgi:hypothetical protein